MAKIFKKLFVGDTVATIGAKCFKKLSTLLPLTAPTIDISETTLNIYDEEGLATSYDILVDGEVKATVEKVSLISFTIGGTSYQAEDGMTWGEWFSSEYNTGNYSYNSPVLALKGVGVSIKDTDLIVANATYTTIGGGSAE